MPRQRIAPNTVGPVAVVLMARPVGATTGELPVPDSVYATKDRKRGWRPGDPVAIEVDGDLLSCRVTGWRGLVRVADVDGTVHMIRRWTTTRASAELLTRGAGFQKLAELERVRSDAARKSVTREAGDRTTTVGDLIGQCLQSPGFAKLASKTQQDYGYAAAHIRKSPLAQALPREVDVAAVRRFMVTYAGTWHRWNQARSGRALASNDDCG